MRVSVRSLTERTTRAPPELQRVQVNGSLGPSSAAPKSFSLSLSLSLSLSVSHSNLFFFRLFSASLLAADDATLSGWLPRLPLVGRKPLRSFRLRPVVVRSRSPTVSYPRPRTAVVPTPRHDPNTHLFFSLYNAEEEVEQMLVFFSFLPSRTPLIWLWKRNGPMRKIW